MTVVFGILIVFILIGISGFFAGSETGIYRLSRFRLRVGVEQKLSFYSMLGEIIRDGQGLVLSVIIGNNLSNYLATSTVTYLILSTTTSAHRAELYATLIMTPALFVFVDIIPKGVYYYRADTLMPRLAPLLWGCYKTFTLSGLVRLLKAISGMLNRMLGLSADSSKAITATERHHIKDIIQETRDEGILSLMQQDIMHRLVDAGSVLVREVMIRLGQVRMVELSTNRTALLGDLRDCSYRRLPVYEGERTDIAGYVDIYETLGSGEDFERLESQVKPIGQIGSTETVVEAVSTMRRENSRIAVVVQKSGRVKSERPKVLGVVTLKDLVGELTGSIQK
jgi:CBS domain containing-hemolysin-like protein